MLQLNNRKQALDVGSLRRIGGSARGARSAGAKRAVSMRDEAPRVVGPKVAVVRGILDKQVDKVDRARRARRPRKSRTSVTVGATSAVSAGAAALLMYFFDPDRGRSRRIRNRDHLLGVGRRTTRRAVHSTTRVARYNVGKLHGATHVLRSAVPNGHHPRIEDTTINDKIRSEVLGRGRFAGMDVHVDCYRGVAHLRGEVPSDEDIKEFVAAVGRVSGVVGVESFLHTPGQVAPNKAAVMAAEASARNAAGDNGTGRRDEEQRLTPI
jgi:osmotically-inducible protein OsmY